MPQIVLATLNARSAHASMGLRCLRANLGALREDSVIREFVIDQKTEEIVKKLLAGAPRIVGLGVYIWNVDETTRAHRLRASSNPPTGHRLGIVHRVIAGWPKGSRLRIAIRSKVRADAIADEGSYEFPVGADGCRAPAVTRCNALRLLHRTNCC